jgi:hypothetical protein
MTRSSRWICWLRVGWAMNNLSAACVKVPASATATKYRRCRSSRPCKDVQRWNLPDGWVISRKPAHPALVSEADFIAAQDISAARGPAPGMGLTGSRKRRYLLAGLLVCGGCGRRRCSPPSPPSPPGRRRCTPTRAARWACPPFEPDSSARFFARHLVGR